MRVLVFVIFPLIDFIDRHSNISNTTISHATSESDYTTQAQQRSESGPEAGSRQHRAPEGAVDAPREAGALHQGGPRPDPDDSGRDRRERQGRLRGAHTRRGQDAAGGRPPAAAAAAGPAAAHLGRRRRPPHHGRHPPLELPRGLRETEEDSERGRRVGEPVLPDRHVGGERRLQHLARADRAARVAHLLGDRPPGGLQVFSLGNLAEVLRYT